MVVVDASGLRGGGGNTELLAGLLDLGLLDLGLPDLGGMGGVEKRAGIADSGDRSRPLAISETALDRGGGAGGPTGGGFRPGGGGAVLAGDGGGA